MQPTHAPTTLAVVDEPTLADVLHAAATYLTRHGWHQGSLYRLYLDIDTGFPPACAAGAIRIVVTGVAAFDPTDPDQLDTLHRAEAVLATHLDPDWVPGETSALCVIADFNDSEFTTLDRVLTELHTAADRWQARQAGGAR